MAVGDPSDTYAFNPAVGEIVLYSFGLCGIRRTELTQQHMVDARMATNLMLQEWGNDTPNLWTVDLVEETLVEGTATYDVDPSTIMILDAYIRTGDGTEEENDRIIWPVSRTEYASFPNKTIQAPPTVFWFDRLLEPTITLWQVPDENGPYLLRYYRCTQAMDAGLPNGQTPGLPPRWLPAFAFGLAEYLAFSYAPDKLPIIQPKAEKFLMNARENDVENVPLFLVPMIGAFRPR